MCEPLKLVTCNLSDFSVAEGVDGLIDTFVQRASQGNVTLRGDLERILNFMARTDLPPQHRRGVKAIQGQKVRFGTEEEPDKLWDFFEMKPTDAAGLSTKTSIAKNLRIYFIKMGNDALGIIGIEPRANQEAFLKSIRVKTKQRD